MKTVNLHMVILILLGSLLLPLGVYAEELVIDGDRQFDFARELMQVGKYDLAVKEFERFMHFFPDDPKSALGSLSDRGLLHAGETL